MNTPFIMIPEILIIISNEIISGLMFRRFLKSSMLLAKYQKNIKKSTSVNSLPSTFLFTLFIWPIID
jgi:hypothetical protein